MKNSPENLNVSDLFTADFEPLQPMHEPEYEATLLRTFDFVFPLFGKDIELTFRASNILEAAMMVQEILKVDPTRYTLRERSPEQSLVDMKSLSLFFCNYTPEDIRYLTTNCHGFLYFWTQKLHAFDADSTEKSLWLGYTRYMDQETQYFVLHYARKRYQEEARVYFDF